MQYWKSLQSGSEYRTSEQQAEDARYQQECAEAAAEQRAEAETPAGLPLTEAEAARLDVEAEAETARQMAEQTEE